MTDKVYNLSGLYNILQLGLKSKTRGDKPLNVLCCGERHGCNSIFSDSFPKLIKRFLDQNGPIINSIPNIQSLLLIIEGTYEYCKRNNNISSCSIFQNQICTDNINCRIFDSRDDLVQYVHEKILSSYERDKMNNIFNRFSGNDYLMRSFVLLDKVEYCASKNIFNDLSQEEILILFKFCLLINLNDNATILMNVINKIDKSSANYNLIFTHLQTFYNMLNTEIYNIYVPFKCISYDNNELIFSYNKNIDPNALGNISRNTLNGEFKTLINKDVNRDVNQDINNNIKNNYLKFNDLEKSNTTQYNSIIRNYIGNIKFWAFTFDVNVIYNLLKESMDNKINTIIIYCGNAHYLRLQLFFNYLKNKEKDSQFNISFNYLFRDKKDLLNSFEQASCPITKISYEMLLKFLQ